MTAIDEIRDNIRGVREFGVGEIHELLLSPKAADRVLVRLDERGFEGSFEEYFQTPVRVTEELTGLRYQLITSFVQ